MSVSSYTAFGGDSSLLLSVFFLVSDTTQRGERERLIVDTVKPCWTLAKEARGKKKREYGVVHIGSDGRLAVWLGSAGVCHVVVCDKETNLELALNFLVVFSTLLGEQSKGGVTETFSVKPDEVLTLLEKFLPCGQLLVLHTNLIKHLKKEADSVQKVA